MNTETTTAPAEGAAGTKKREKFTLSADAQRGMWAAVAVTIAVIASASFALSFMSVMHAMQQWFGAASWAVPIILDVAIAGLTVISIGLELSELSGRAARLFSRALVGYTIWANAQDAHTWAGRGAHCLPPIVFVGMVTITEGAVRRLVGLSAEDTMDKVRVSRWLLAPLATFRLWRRMRLWEITSYKTAVSREQQQSASRALLREWHGRSWKRSAPRAERLAVKLQAATERPVSELLTESAESIVSAADAALRPLSAEQKAELAAEQLAAEKAERAAAERLAAEELAVARAAAERLAAEQAAAAAAARTRRAMQSRRVSVARARKAAQVAAQVPPPVTAQVPRPKAAKAPVKAAAKRPAPLPKHPVRRNDAELMIEARAVNEQAIAKTGAPAGVDRLKAALGIGQERARKFRALLDAETAPPAPAAVPATAPAQVHPVVLPIAHANGSQVPLSA